MFGTPLLMEIESSRGFARNPLENRMDTQGADATVCDLRHGIQLSIYRESGPFKVQMVGDFLAKAREYFGRLKMEPYKGNPYCQTFQNGSTRLATMHLTYRSEEGAPPFMSARLWTNAVNCAATSVHALEGMIERLEVWKQAVVEQNPSPFLRGAIGLLDQPGGDLRAMQMMLKDSLDRDLAEGRYRPGEIIDS